MAKRSAQILIVDDEQHIRRVLEAVMTKEGHQVLTAENGRKALEVLRNGEKIDLIVSDLIMPDINGVELLSAAREIDPDIPVVMMTAHGTIKSAVDAMKLGAFDYITKPFELEDVKQLVKNALDRREMGESKPAPPRARTKRGHYSEVLVGSSPAMREVVDMIERVKDSRASVLVRGESGTGKEGIAKALHYRSIRADKPFVPVACVALSEQLLQSELFGHEKGSFTGSVGQKKGRFEMANHGTLFLDEIGDIPQTVQMMLLRVIQEREFERVGGNEVIKVDVRLVTATNQDLEKMVAEGKFREDLFYRLHVITLYVPPLRERTEDIPELVNHFISIYSKENAKPVAAASTETLEALAAYSWPGNVRELENCIERAVVLADPDAVEITPDLLPKSVINPKSELLGRPQGV